jgi:hypothetical protein
MENCGDYRTPTSGTEKLFVWLLRQSSKIKGMSVLNKTVVTAAGRPKQPNTQLKLKAALLMSEIALQ